MVLGDCAVLRRWECPEMSLACRPNLHEKQLLFLQLLPPPQPCAAVCARAQSSRLAGLPPGPLHETVLSHSALRHTSATEYVFIGAFTTSNPSKRSSSCSSSLDKFCPQVIQVMHPEVPLMHRLTCHGSLSPQAGHSAVTADRRSSSRGCSMHGALEVHVDTLYKISNVRACSSASLHIVLLMDPAIKQRTGGIAKGTDRKRRGWAPTWRACRAPPAGRPRR